jgi:hypothetical protein
VHHLWGLLVPALWTERVHWVPHGAPNLPSFPTHWALNPSTPCQVVCHLTSHSRRHDCPRRLMPRLPYAVA